MGPRSSSISSSIPSGELDWRAEVDRSTVDCISGHMPHQVPAEVRPAAAVKLTLGIEMHAPAGGARAKPKARAGAGGKG